MNEVLKAFWSISVNELLDKLKTTPQGLVREYTRKRFNQFGENPLKPQKSIKYSGMLVSQFNLLFSSSFLLPHS